MGDCGTSEYEMIELAGVFELRGAQVVSAEIDTINRGARTASITLAGSCEALAGKDLTEVPFFYHCANSTGTLSDLAKGHNAFTPGDTVYVLFVPASDNIIERFYIVGHTDIKGNINCLNEYIVLFLGDDVTIGHKLFVNIFDVSRGQQLDLSTFVPVDENSPEPPAALPAQYTSAVISWVLYNFENTTAGVTTSHTIEQVKEPIDSVTLTDPGFYVYVPPYPTNGVREFISTQYNTDDDFPTRQTLYRQHERWSGVWDGPGDFIYTYTPVYQVEYEHTYDLLGANTCGYRIIDDVAEDQLEIWFTYRGRTLGQGGRVPLEDGVATLLSSRLVETPMGEIFNIECEATSIFEGYYVDAQYSGTSITHLSIAAGNLIDNLDVKFMWADVRTVGAYGHYFFFCTPYSIAVNNLSPGNNTTTIHRGCACTSRFTMFEDVALDYSEPVSILELIANYSVSLSSSFNAFFSSTFLWALDQYTGGAGYGAIVLNGAPPSALVQRKRSLPPEEL